MELDSDRLRIPVMKEQKSRFDVIGQLGSLRRYARSLTRNAAEAEDLVQDALVRAYERRQTFRPGGNLRGWLLSVVHTTFLDGFRSRRAEALRVEQAALLVAPDAELSQEHSVHLEQTRQAFFSLPDEQRAALHLVAIEGLSYEDAASMLGIPTGTLMSRISRARASLRTLESEAPIQRAGHLRIVGRQG
jgi:RNA polymerase sigma factor (sigma-70 family)